MFDPIPSEWRGNRNTEAKWSFSPHSIQQKISSASKQAGSEIP